jgi:hypothetical protein
MYPQVKAPSPSEKFWVHTCTQAMKKQDGIPALSHSEHHSNTYQEITRSVHMQLQIVTEESAVGLGCVLHLQELFLVCYQ